MASNATGLVYEEKMPQAVFAVFQTVIPVAISPRSSLQRYNAITYPWLAGRS